MSSSSSLGKRKKRPKNLDKAPSPKIKSEHALLFVCCSRLLEIYPDSLITQILTPNKVYIYFFRVNTFTPIELKQKNTFTQQYLPIFSTNKEESIQVLKREIQSYLFKEVQDDNILFIDSIIYSLDLLLTTDNKIINIDNEYEYFIEFINKYMTEISSLYPDISYDFLYESLSIIKHLKHIKKYKRNGMFCFCYFISKLFPIPFLTDIMNEETQFFKDIVYLFIHSHKIELLSPEFVGFILNSISLNSIPSCSYRNIINTTTWDEDYFIKYLCDDRYIISSLSSSSKERNWGNLFIQICPPAANCILKLQRLFNNPKILTFEDIITPLYPHMLWDTSEQIKILFFDKDFIQWWKHFVIKTTTKHPLYEFNWKILQTIDIHTIYDSTYILEIYQQLLFQSLNTFIYNINKIPRFTDIWKLMIKEDNIFKFKDKKQGFTLKIILYLIERIFNEYSNNIEQMILSIILFISKINTLLKVNDIINFKVLYSTLFQLLDNNLSYFSEFVKEPKISLIPLDMSTYFIDEIRKKLETPEKLEDNYFLQFGKTTNTSFIYHNEFCKRVIHSCSTTLSINPLSITKSTSTCLNCELCKIFHLDNSIKLKLYSYISNIAQYISDKNIRFGEFCLLFYSTKQNSNEFKEILKILADDFARLLEIIAWFKYHYQSIKAIEKVYINIFKEDIKIHELSLKNIENRYKRTSNILKDHYNHPFHKLIEYKYHSSTLQRNQSKEELLQEITNYVSNIIRDTSSLLTYINIKELTNNFTLYSCEELRNILKISTELYSRLEYIYKAKDILENRSAIHCLLSWIFNNKNLQLSILKDNYYSDSVPTLNKNIIPIISWLYKYHDIIIQKQHFDEINDFYQYLVQNIDKRENENDYIILINKLLISSEFLDKFKVLQDIIHELSLLKVDNITDEFNINTQLDFEQLKKRLNEYILENNNSNNINTKLPEEWIIFAGSKIRVNLIPNCDDLIKSNDCWPYNLFTIPQLLQLETQYKYRNVDTFKKILCSIIPEYDINMNILYNQILNPFSKYLKGLIKEPNCNGYINCTIMYREYINISDVISFITTNKVIHPSELIICTPSITWHELKVRLQRSFIDSIQKIVVLYIEDLPRNIFNKLNDYIPQLTTLQTSPTNIYFITTKYYYENNLQSISWAKKCYFDIVPLNYFNQNITIFQSDSPGMGKTQTVYNQYGIVQPSLVIPGTINKEEFIKKINTIRNSIQPLTYLPICLYPFIISLRESEINEFLIKLLIFNFIETPSTIYPIFKYDSLPIAIEIQTKNKIPQLLSLFRHKENVFNINEFSIPQSPTVTIQKLMAIKYGVHITPEITCKQDIPKNFFYSYRKILQFFELWYCLSQRLHIDKAKKIALDSIIHSSILFSNRKPLYKDNYPFYPISKDITKDFKLTDNQRLQFQFIFDRINANIPTIILGKCNSGKTFLLRFISQKKKILPQNKKIIILSKDTTEDDIGKIINHLSINEPSWIIFDEIQNAPHLFYLIYDIIIHKQYNGKILPNNLIFIGTIDTDNINKYYNTPFHHLLLECIVDIGDYIIEPYFAIDNKNLNEEIKIQLHKITQYFITNNYNIDNRSINIFIVVYHTLLDINNTLNDPFQSLGKYFKDQSNTKEDYFLYIIITCTFISFHSTQYSFDYRNKIWEELSKQLYKPEEYLYNLYENVLLYIKTYFKDYIPNNIIIHQQLLENLLILCGCISSHIPLCLIGKSGTSKTVSIRILEKYYNEKTNNKFIYLSGQQDNNENKTLSFFKNIMQWKKENLKDIIIIFDDVQENDISIMNRILHDSDYNIIPFSIICISNNNIKQSYNNRRLLTSYTTPIVFKWLKTIDKTNTKTDIIQKYVNNENIISLRNLYSIISLLSILPKNFISNQDIDNMNYRISRSNLCNFIKDYYINAEIPFNYQYITLISSYNISSYFNINSKYYHVINCNTSDIYKVVSQILSLLPDPNLLILEQIQSNSELIPLLYDMLGNSNTLQCKINNRWNNKKYNIHPNFRCILQMSITNWEILDIQYKNRLQVLYLHEFNPKINDNINTWIRNICTPFDTNKNILLFKSSLQEYPKELLISGYTNNWINGLIDSLKYINTIPNTIEKQMDLITELLYLRIPINGILAVLSSKLDLSFKKSDEILTKLKERTLENLIKYYYEKNNNINCYSVLSNNIPSVIFTYSNENDIIQELKRNNRNFTILSNENIQNNLNNIGICSKKTTNDNINTFIQGKSVQKILIISIQSMYDTSLFSDILSSWNHIIIDNIKGNKIFPDLSKISIKSIIQSLPKVDYDSLLEKAINECECMSYFRKYSNLYDIFNFFMNNCEYISNNWKLDICRAEELRELPYETAFYKLITYYIQQLLSKFILLIDELELHKIEISIQILKQKYNK